MTISRTTPAIADTERDTRPGRAGMGSPSEVDQNILATAVRVPFTLMPSATETARVHTFKIMCDFGPGASMSG